MTDPLLRVESAGVSYPGSSEPALEGVDLDVTPGAAIGVVGESGSGKTTLGRLLVGTIRPTTGRVEVEGQPWSAVPRTDARRRSVQMIFQDPFSSLNPMWTARQTVGEVYRTWHRVSAAEAKRRAVSVLEEVGLRGAVIDRRPGGLSGGQLQRVGIARALACDPLVLVADEPTSALDASAQAQVLNLLLDLRQSRSLAMILISHDLSVIQYLTDEALVVYRGRVVERGPTEALLTTPRHPYTDALVASIPGSRRAPEFARNDVDRTSGCVFAPRCPYVEARCLEAQPAFSGQRLHDVACLHPLSAASAPLQGLGRSESNRGAR